MEVIIVSGTPGTGKTTLAKKLAIEKGYKYFDVNKLVKKNKLHEEYDKKRTTYLVDTDKLNALLVKKIEEEKNKDSAGLIIDSHLSHYIDPNYVDKCIITKCDLQTLKKRLEKRNYSGEKIRENMDAEIFDTCRVEALEFGHKVEVVQTD